MHKIFIFFLLIIFLNGCQAAKDGLTQKKRSNADEFLVEKKNPLVLPPNFGDLPTPDENQNNQSFESDIESLLSKGKLKTSESNTKTGTSNIESSVLDKIKNK